MQNGRMPNQTRGGRIQGNRRLASRSHHTSNGLEEGKSDRNTCDTTAVKRKTQFEEGINDQKRRWTSEERRKAQPQILIYQIGQSGHADNRGSKRRRVQDKKGECFEDTNSMKKRLEGDDWIE